MLIAAGAAGMLAGIDHPPGTPGRAELTWATDREVSPALDQAALDLVALSGEVDNLGVEARRILAAVAARDEAGVADGLSSGSDLQLRISRDAQALRGRLESLPVGQPYPRLRISLIELARHEVAVQAVDSTRGINDAWSRLVSGAFPASRLADLLADHDTAMAQAAGQGREQAYADAIATIETARALLDQAGVLRDQVANTSSVSTLDQWLRRNRTFDDALEALYAAFRDSNGKVTTEVTKAFAEEEAARAQLPPDTRGLVLIMAEISQGGLNQAVIAIEQAADQLGHALETFPDSGGTAPGR